MINRCTQYETNIYYHKILQQKYKITNFSKKYENAHKISTTANAITKYERKRK